MYNLYLRNFSATILSKIFIVIFIININLSVQVQAEKEGILENCLEIDGPFCVNSTNYPTEAIHRALQKNFKLYKKFFEDTAEVPAQAKPDDSAAHRFDYGTTETSICNVENRIVYPQYGHDTNEVKYRIVNDNIYKQRIRISTCSQSEKPCKDLVAKNLPNGWKTMCKQRRTKTTLLGIKDESVAVALDNLEIKATLFEIPSYCECVLISEPQGF